MCSCLNIPYSVLFIECCIDLAVFFFLVCLFFFPTALLGTPLVLYNINL